MKPKFYNKDGSLTRYALACGYIEHGRCGTRLAQICSNGVLIVTTDDGVTLYDGLSVTYARQAIARYERRWRKYTRKPWSMERCGDGVRIREHGVVRFTGASVAEAMQVAEGF